MTLRTAKLRELHSLRFGNVSGVLQSFAGAYFAVHGSSASDVWVTLMGKVHHFNGSVWADETPPVSQFDILRDVWAASPTNVWVVGDRGQVMHRGASTWASVPSGASSTSAVNTVWGSGPNDVWIGASNGYVARWNGTSFVPFTTGRTNAVLNITGRGPNDVFLVYADQVLHWDGTSVRTVDVGATSGTFASAWAAPTSSSAWVVGTLGLARRKVP